MVHDLIAHDSSHYNQKIKFIISYLMKRKRFLTAQVYRMGLMSVLCTVCNETL